MSWKQLAPLFGWVLISVALGCSDRCKSVYTDAGTYLELNSPTHAAKLYSVRTVKC